MEHRAVSEKGKVKAEDALQVAEALLWLLTPTCERIEIAGSLRRQRPEVSDIELLVIPRWWAGLDLLDTAAKRMIANGVLDYRRNKRGSPMYGLQNKYLLHVASGIPIDIFSTDAECWPMALVIRTGPKESNITIATAAQRKGWRLKAYGGGFDTPNGPIRCQSEREVFELVGLPYLEPQDRR